VAPQRGREREHGSGPQTGSGLTSSHLDPGNSCGCGFVEEGSRFMQGCSQVSVAFLVAQCVCGVVLIEPVMATGGAGASFLGLPAKSGGYWIRQD